MTADLVIGILLLLAIWKGWNRGLVAMLASFILFIGAIIIAGILGGAIGSSLFGTSVLAPVTGFFVCFLVIIVIGNFIIKKVKPKKGIVAGADKILGAVAGGLRMLLTIGLVLALLRLFHLPSASSVGSSKLYRISLNSIGLLASPLKPLTEFSEHMFDQL